LNKPPSRHNGSIYTPTCGQACARLALSKKNSSHRHPPYRA